MHSTILGECHFVDYSTFINRFINVTARDMQSLKFSIKFDNCLSTLICSVLSNLNILCKTKNSYIWFLVVATVWIFLFFFLKTKILCRYLKNLILFY